MVGGDAVLEAVRPAGVLGDVAAEGAGGLARRIGRVVQAVRRDRLGEPGVDHAGLHHGAAAHRIDREDAVQPGERDEHRVAVGRARRPRARCRRRARRTARPRRCSSRTTSRTSSARARHDDHAGIRLVGGQAVHGVGRRARRGGAAPSGDRRSRPGASISAGFMCSAESPAARGPSRWCARAVHLERPLRRRW